MSRCMKISQNRSPPPEYSTVYRTDRRCPFRFETDVFIRGGHGLTLRQMVCCCLSPPRLLRNIENTINSSTCSAGQQSCSSRVHRVVQKPCGPKPRARFGWWFELWICVRRYQRRCRGNTSGETEGRSEGCTLACFRVVTALMPKAPPPARCSQSPKVNTRVEPTPRRSHSDNHQSAEAAILSKKKSNRSLSKDPPTRSQQASESTAEAAGVSCRTVQPFFWGAGSSETYA